MMNYISNAVKFCLRGEIGLEIKLINQESKGAESHIKNEFNTNSPTNNSDDYGIEVSISDTGKGISPEAQKFLFIEEFKEDSKNNFYGGGSGLTIVKKLADSLGFNVYYQPNTNKVYGSRFNLFIPLTKDNVILYKTLGKKNPSSGSKQISSNRSSSSDSINIAHKQISKSEIGNERKMIFDTNNIDHLNKLAKEKENVIENYSSEDESSVNIQVENENPGFNFDDKPIKEDLELENSNTQLFSPNPKNEDLDFSLLKKKQQSYNGGDSKVIKFRKPNASLSNSKTEEQSYNGGDSKVIKFRKPNASLSNSKTAGILKSRKSNPKVTYATNYNSCRNVVFRNLTQKQNTFCSKRSIPKNNNFNLYRSSLMKTLTKSKDSDPYNTLVNKVSNVFIFNNNKSLHHRFRKPLQLESKNFEIIAPEPPLDKNNALLKTLNKQQQGSSLAKMNQLVSLAFQTDKFIAKNESNTIGDEIKNPLLEKACFRKTSLFSTSVSFKTSGLKSENSNTIRSVLNQEAIKEKDNMEHIVTQQFTCLVIDDEPLIRSSNIRLLKNNLHKNFQKDGIELQVFEAEDGIEALYAIYLLQSKGIKIDFILIDESMKFMRGSEAIAIISKYMDQELFSKMKIFICSAYSSSDTNIDKNLREKAVTQHILKPLNVNKVKDIFSTLLENTD
eukprot:CAMPEP_0170539222 /NCGR_PEP_ID=MMETSP0209-20121228/103791_1 /TAXON_ID=665100 ORGANISM="Litonotus pictus, Strain P1" /NCGR_SAMPLE_ID=MMETSP0209 /ASSEMBLY_ACC=CAM_ASM_000301 /LENGTH=671 /DNA_ID=CAMNT_0010841087 /DNA_START=1882 /DNA_END=3898 /DNA_ORIENTATION=+